MTGSPNCSCHVHHVLQKVLQLAVAIINNKQINVSHRKLSWYQPAARPHCLHLHIDALHPRCP